MASNDRARPLDLVLLKGAFLLGKHDSSFLEDEERRIKYFHQSGHHSDDTIEFAEETVTKNATLLTVMRLLHKVGVVAGDDTPSGVEWAVQEFSAACFNVMRSRICEHFMRMTLVEKLTWLVELRKELYSASRSTSSSADDDAASAPSYLQDLVLQLNEIVVLTEESNKQGDEDDFAKDLSQLVSKWVYKASVVGAAIQCPRSDDPNRFSPAAKASSTVGAIVPQVRGTLTDAMLHPSSGDFYAPCAIFTLMQDRVVISREECFEAFVKNFKGDKSLEELCSMFAFGVHQLCYCGLVNEKLGSKNNVLYERTALVWCSGT